MEGNSINIIIVDDDPVYLRSLDAIIKQEKSLNCIGSFPNVSEVLEFLKDSPDVSVILLDIGLPDISGIEAIEKIKSLNIDVSIVMLTVFDDDEKIFNALCKGASGYLLKAESDAKIIDAIKDVYSGGAVFSPSIAHRILNFFSKKTKRKYDLTKREIEVLEYMKECPTKRKIAEELFISEMTVISHVKNIYKKLHVNCASQAIAKAMDEGLI